MSVLNWQLRAVLPELRDQGRLNVLIALLLHANIRNRAYPTMVTLCKETAFEMEAVTAAKHWLADRGAFVLVPYKLRVDEERKLPIRQHIYQLTGLIRASDDTVREYLYMSPEAREGVAQVIESIKVSAAEISAGKVSIAETKGSSSIKGGSLSEGGFTDLDESRARENKTTFFEDLPARPEIYTLYEQNIGALTKLIGDELKDAADIYPADWIAEAFKIAVVDKNVRNWKYIRTILESWRIKGRGAQLPKPAAVGTRHASSAAAQTDPVPPSPFVIRAGDQS